jgi:hypothetical protein
MMHPTVADPIIVHCLSDKSAFLVRNGDPDQHFLKSLAIMKSLDESQWHPIHSIREGDVHRCVLTAVDSHRRELRKAQELDTVTLHKEAIMAGERYAKIMHSAAAAVGVKLLPVQETEFIRVQPNSMGQYRHCDSMMNAMAGIQCTQDGSPPTVVLDYTYRPFPQNMKAGGMPRDWANIPFLKWDWRAGDILYIRINRLHGGPANGLPWTRYANFGATTYECSDFVSFSDSIVVFEEVYYGV